MHRFTLYTLVDITHTSQVRNEPSKELQFKQEKNFNTVLQTIGIRANVFYTIPPLVTEVKGSLVGFDTDEIIRVWRFDFYVEQEGVFSSNGNPIANLINDFDLVPYISGLTERMEQKFKVFASKGTGKNILFTCVQ